MTFSIDEAYKKCLHYFKAPDENSRIKVTLTSVNMPGSYATGLKPCSQAYIDIRDVPLVL